MPYSWLGEDGKLVLHTKDRAGVLHIPVVITSPHVGLFAISVGNKFERTEMTLQERLRELIPNGYGYNSEFAHTMCEAADRIDELEKRLQIAQDGKDHRDVTIRVLEKQLEAKQARIDELNWVRIEDALPEDGQAVLVRYAGNNWLREHKLSNGETQKFWRWKAVLFVRGRTSEEITGEIRFEDEWGNNLRPYGWREFGPGILFGQDVTHWAAISDPCKEN